MKKISLSVIVSLLILLSKTHASPDSIRVILCTYENSIECFGLDRYTKTIEYFNSFGNTDSVYNYVLSKCPVYPIDSVFQHVGDDFYTYDSLQRLIISENFSYSAGGNSEIMWTYSYDSSGNRINILVKDGPPGNLTNNNQDSIVYDSLNRKIYEMYLRWNTQATSWDSTDLYYWSYNSMNSPTFNMHRHLNSQTLVIDTNYVYYRTYDSLNRITRIDYYLFNPHRETHSEFIYDSFSNTIQSNFSNTYNGYVDSTRALETYSPTNHKSESLYQSWDTLQFKWNSTSRKQFSYDASDSFVKIFYFQCPDSTCSDTANFTTFVYDASHRLLSSIDSSFNAGIWTGHYALSNVYDSNGNLISSIISDPPDHCSRTEQYSYDYNSNNRLIHEYYYVGTCDYSSSDCYYYTLKGDSMLVDVRYPFQTCRGDTIYPEVSVIGGISPYSYQWTPPADVLHPNQLTTGIVADTVRTYILQVTDSNGVAQTASFSLNVSCFPTGISNAGKEEFSLIVYPNPFHDFVNIDINKNNIQVALSDIEGRELKTVFSKNGKIIFDTNGLKAGIYFMKIFSEDGFNKIVKLVAE